jgi:hypothetical protein
MSQNRSSAVMAQRAEPHDSLDDFPTQPWGVRALLEHVIATWLPFDADRKVAMTCWEPASNRGYMSKALKEYFRIVRTSDVFDYSCDPLTVDVQDSVCDFLIEGLESDVLKKNGARWVISNPPFRLAEEFIARALRVRDVRGVAMLVRTGFLEGVGRYERLYRPRPPSVVAHFTERLPLVRGRVDPVVSTATAYCWLVWMPGVPPQPPLWIPPCRRRLESASDYPSPALVAAETAP